MERIDPGPWVAGAIIAKAVSCGGGGEIEGRPALWPGADGPSCSGRSFPQTTRWWPVWPAPRAHFLCPPKHNSFPNHFFIILGILTVSCDRSQGMSFPKGKQISVRQTWTLGEAGLAIGIFLSPQSQPKMAMLAIWGFFGSNLAKKTTVKTTFPPGTCSIRGI